MKGGAPLAEREFGAWRKPGPICLRCGEDLPPTVRAVCGVRTPCPTCGHPYPLGDCSD